MFLKTLANRRALITSGLVGALLAGGLVMAPAAHADDWAIICAVNQYPRLRPGSNLAGCVNDAKLFATKLKNYGFKESNMVMLADGAASHDAILAAIRGLNGKVTGRDRVVFYFAGHGTVDSSGDSVILPGDARDDAETNDIQTTDLYDAVKSLPAQGKTIVLDSCHSGGMVRGAKGLRNAKFQPRTYVRTKRLNRAGKRSGTKEWQEVSVNGADDISTQTGTSDGKICYFTAALKTQTAAETECEGERHGVFTFSLAKYMDGKKSLWESLSAGVSADVSNLTDGEQKPVLYPTDFLQQVAFGVAAAPDAPPQPAPTPAPITLDKLYALTSPDPSKVSIVLRPTLSPVVVNKDKIRFDVTVGAEGYLVVIGKDPNGKMSLIYPRGGGSTDISAAKVSSGQVVGVPNDPSKAFIADAVGTDSVKALLFTDEEAARALVRSFSRGPLQMKRGQKMREWVETTVESPGPGYYTSEVITQIVSGIVTGSAAPGAAAP